MAMAAGTWLRLRCALSPATTLLLVYPPLWALGEWLRNWVATGFPWIVSGYAHVNSPLAGYAPLVGVYGIGWLAALLAACVVVAVLGRRRMALGLAATATATTNPVLLLGVVAVACLTVGLRRSDHPWSGSFRLYLLFGLVIVVVRLVLRVLLGGGVGTTVLLDLPAVPLPPFRSRRL